LCAHTQAFCFSFATSVPIPAARFSPPYEGLRLLSHQRKSLVSTRRRRYPFVFPISVARACVRDRKSPDICFYFYLEMRGPMFRWSGSSVVDKAVALTGFGGLWSGCSQALFRWLHRLTGFGFTHFFLGEIATAAIKKSGCWITARFAGVGNQGASFVGFGPA
jgi:hypothetical protein